MKIQIKDIIPGNIYRYYGRSSTNPSHLIRIGIKGTYNEYICLYGPMWGRTSFQDFLMPDSQVEQASNEEIVWYEACEKVNGIVPKPEKQLVENYEIY